MRSIVGGKRGMRLLVLWLWLLAGCNGGTAIGASFPIHPRPEAPKALVSPEKTFIKCGDHYYCVTPDDLEGLRKWAVRIQGVVEKYEHATKAINNAGP